MGKNNYNFLMKVNIQSISNSTLHNLNHGQLHQNDSCHAATKFSGKRITTSHEKKPKYHNKQKCFKKQQHFIITDGRIVLRKRINLHQQHQYPCPLDQSQLGHRMSSLLKSKRIFEALNIIWVTTSSSKRASFKMSTLDFQRQESLMLFDNALHGLN